MKLLFRLLSYFIILAGVALLSYPLVANVVSQHYMNKSIATYEETLKHTDTSHLDEQKRLAIEYDDNLVGKPLHDPFKEDAGYVLPENYMEVLNVGGDGVMGTIEIPKINVNLPIYHTVEETVLQKGIGHIDYTSTIYGGKNRHAWLSGHRGLPNALMFTDLNLLKKGDVFTIHVLGEKHHYKVFDIQVIDPADFEQTRPEMGRDLITLVTCTPYGVNSHRLLVTGERTFDVDDAQPTTKYPVFGMQNVYLALLIIVVFALSLFVGIAVFRRRKQREVAD